MHVINARNVNGALVDGLWWLHTAGIRNDSRNGPVIVSPELVATVYANPTERVLFGALRDANPFFHLMESLWMLAGREDVAFPAHFAKQIAEYSDDGVTLNGAYGYRWRSYFEHDQLEWVIAELRRDSNSRRCVLSMWDGANDPASVSSGSKDVPCNTHAYFTVSGGMLEMTVCCRSNDVIWGAYGANAVHFSFLMEYIASSVGVGVGRYIQLSNNFHIYADRADVKRLHHASGAPLITADDRYALSCLRTVPLICRSADHWNSDLAEFMEAFTDKRPAVHFELFFLHVVQPMLKAHTAYKVGDFKQALYWASHIHADDWRMACEEWLERREVAAHVRRYGL